MEIHGLCRFHLEELRTDWAGGESQPESFGLGDAWPIVGVEIEAQTFVLRHHAPNGGFEASDVERSTSSKEKAML